MTVEDKAYFQEYFKKLCKIGVTEKKNKEESSKVSQFFVLWNVNMINNLLNSFKCSDETR